MNLQLKGNTNQFTTTGKNIFNYLDSVFQTAGKGEVDISIKDTVKLTCTETTSNTNLFYKTKIADNLLTNETTYIISSIGDNNVKQSLKLQLRNKDGSNAGLPTNNSIVYDSAYSLFVVGNPLAINNSTIVEAGTSCTITNIMVRASTTDDTYEPYTGGIASPNPDYPQDIEVVTGENNIYISKKNLIDFENPKVLSNNGIEGVIDNITGKITLNGTATANAFLQFNIVPLNINDVVSISINNPVINSGVGVRLYASGAAQSTISCGVVNKKLENYTNPSKCNIFQIRITKNTILTNFELFPQVEFGSNSTTFEKGKAYISYPINLNSLELCTIASAQDYIYKNNNK